MVGTCRHESSKIDFDKQKLRISDSLVSARRPLKMADPLTVGVVGGGVLL